MVSKYRIIIVLLCALMISGCSDDSSPKEEIYNLINEVQERFEQRESGTLKRYIAEDYSDEYGYSNKDIVRFAAGYILRRQVIHLNTKIVEIQLSEGDTAANVDLIVAVSKKPLTEGDVRLVQAEFHRLTLKMVKNRKWLLQSLKWQQINLDAYLGV